MGVKRALLVGCNYPGTDNALRGCVNDVHTIKAMLQKSFGFEPANIVVMIDTDANGVQPTGKNIKEGLMKITGESTGDDVMVFHFSGHGTQVSDDGGEAAESDGKDEAICPTDMNLICDDDLRAIFSKLPNTVKFTMISDCCHSGSMLDHPEQQISGDKDPNAPPGGASLPMDSLMGMFGLKELGSTKVGSEEVKNRGLEESMFVKMFNQVNGLSGERAMGTSNVRDILEKKFGADASVKALKYAGMLNKYLQSSGLGNGTGGQAKAVNMLSKLLGMCAGPSAAEPGQGSAPAATPQQPAAGGAPVATTAAAGSKPPPGEQLDAEKGILITGCQSHETSADACPSGDPNKAFGALTNALDTCVKAVKQNDPAASITYKQLVHDVRAVLLKTGFDQNPCLECSDHNADAPFIC